MNESLVILLFILINVQNINGNHLQVAGSCQPGPEMDEKNRLCDNNMELQDIGGPSLEFEDFYNYIEDPNIPTFDMKDNQPLIDSFFTTEETAKDIIDYFAQAKKDNKDTKMDDEFNKLQKEIVVEDYTVSDRLPFEYIGMFDDGVTNQEKTKKKDQIGRLKKELNPLENGIIEAVKILKKERANRIKKITFMSKRAKYGVKAKKELRDKIVKEKRTMTELKQKVLNILNKRKPTSGYYYMWSAMESGSVINKYKIGFTSVRFDGTYGSDLKKHEAKDATYLNRMIKCKSSSINAKKAEVCMDATFCANLNNLKLTNVSPPNKFKDMRGKTEWFSSTTGDDGPTIMLNLFTILNNEYGNCKWIDIKTHKGGDNKLAWTNDISV